MKIRLIDFAVESSLAPIHTNSFVIVFVWALVGKLHGSPFLVVEVLWISCCDLAYANIGIGGVGSDVSVSSLSLLW